MTMDEQYKKSNQLLILCCILIVHSKTRTWSFQRKSSLAVDSTCWACRYTAKTKTVMTTGVTIFRATLVTLGGLYWKKRMHAYINIPGLQSLSWSQSLCCNREDKEMLFIPFCSTCQLLNYHFRFLQLKQLYATCGQCTLYFFPVLQNCRVNALSYSTFLCVSIQKYVYCVQ